MATKKKKRKGVKPDSITTNIAAEISSSVGSTRKGRDQLTRVTSPIKGANTMSKQWSRQEGWTP